ncbi:hypothetical protein R1sor_008450 [Riccia sorocarpa]|uniref:Uncharacterized protein n=1 Tax=Riccia sorocarpa TaxID=122646 RepID=A0ABD3HWV9_9MARC
MDRGDESPTAARSEAEELEVQDMEQDADPDAHLDHEDEAASDEAEDGLEPIDMQHMVIHEHRTEHNGAWCIEVDKIFYPHIGNSVFKVKEEMTLFLKVNDKWSPEGVAAFISEFSDDKDLCAVYCEDCDEFLGVFAKSLKFDMKKIASWVRKKFLISRFWDARSHMYNTGRIASRIVTRAFVVSRPRRIDADDVFEWLTKFEEEKKGGKRKTTTPRTGNNKKKPRPVEAVPEEPFDPMTKFRPINGLSDSDLKLAWTVLEEGKVWVTKLAKYQGPEDVVSLEDFCKVLKATRDLEKIILKYWNTRDLTVSKEFTIVSVMEYGQQLVDFTSAIKEIKDAKIIFEVGCYENERPVRKTNLAKPTWQLVYAFVSLGPEKYKPALVENFDYRPHSCELRYKTWKEEFTLDKGAGSEAVNFKNKAPRWDFVGIEPAEDSKPYVHPGSKRQFFCTRLLNNFSSEGSTVLDFFS